MRVMWVINSMIEEISAQANRKAGFGGGWIVSMLDRLREYRDVEMHLVVFGKVSEYFSVKKNDVVFHIFPGFSALYKNGGGSRAVEIWKNILGKANPDIIHIYGTERPTCLELVENFSEIPKIVSLQGIIRECYKHYYGDMEFRDILKYNTPVDVLLGSTGYFGRKKFKKTLPYEYRILNAVKYVEGRTNWDKKVSVDINPNLKYYDCKRMLRKEFYGFEKWDANNINKHTLFTHQGNYAIKGLHYLIDALAVIKRKYPDIELRIAGQNPYGKTSFKGRLSINGYSRFIRKKIKSLNLENNIRYIGSLGPEQVVGELKKANVMIVPSSIENSSNSIAEAMIIGTPCVASYVGGNPEMLGFGELGLLYPYNDSVLLADAVDRLFSSNKLASAFSERARTEALKRHDRDFLTDNLYNIYKDVINDSVGKE